MKEAEGGPSQEGRETSGGCLFLQTDTFIEYDGETPRGSHSPRIQSLEESVRLSERQVHGGCHPGSGAHHH